MPGSTGSNCETRFGIAADLHPCNQLNIMI
jgi:hypothetical protein